MKVLLATCAVATATAVVSAAVPTDQNGFAKIDALTVPGLENEYPVSVRGVVVADMRGLLQSFYLQMYASEADSDKTTSEAILVKDSSSMLGNVFGEGDAIELVGVAFNGEGEEPVLEVRNNTILALEACDDPKVTVGSGTKLCREVNLAQVSLPFDSIDYPRSVFGMLAEVADTYTTDAFEIGRYSTVKLYHKQIRLNPLQYMSPGPDAQAKSFSERDTELVVLEAPSKFDDDSHPTLFPKDGFKDSVTKSERRVLTAGMKFPSSLLTGHVVLRPKKFSHWRLMTTQYGMTVVPENMLQLDTNRMDFPEFNIENTDTVFRIAGMNVENYFTSFCSNSKKCRGAENEQDFKRQREKLFLTIGRMNAALLGIQEIENDANNTAHTHLVEFLNEFLQENGFDDQVYDFVVTEQSGPDAIKSGIIYQPRFVQPVGKHALYEFKVKQYARARDSLAQTFKFGSELVTVVSNHLQYKGRGALHPSCSDRPYCDQYSDEEMTTHPCVVDGGCDKRDGQGNWATARLWEAEELTEWLKTNPTKELPEGNNNYILLGDFNAYAREDAVTHIVNEGYVDLASRDIEIPYSYNFGGAFQTLDYAFVSSSIENRCGNTIEWHTNSPESTKFGFRPIGSAEGLNDIYDLTVFRSSDHDPILFACDFAPTTVEPTSGTASATTSLVAVFAAVVAVVLL